MIDQNARASILTSLGGSPEVIQALLDYNHNPFVVSPLPPQLTLPLPDEPFVSFWQQIAAAPDGVWQALRQVLPQFAFPIREGISAEDEYRRATRRGVPPMGMNLASGLSLAAPEGLFLQLYPTPAGTIPILSTPERVDFVTLTRALSHRNEPHPIPDSMGACMVSGYNNWARIHALRRTWAQTAADSSEGAWSQYFESIIPQKALYQDRFMILSGGYYSAITPEAVGFNEDQWRAISFTIRREHECVHYLTLRLFGIMRNNLLDELIADYAGIVAALGYFRADWFLRFIGLEAYPQYRQGGRLENYRGSPPLSDQAFDLLKTLVYRAAHTLERFDQGYHHERPQRNQARMLLALTRLTLEELAATDGELSLARAVEIAHQLTASANDQV